MGAGGEASARPSSNYTTLFYFERRAVLAQHVLEAEHEDQTPDSGCLPVDARVDDRVREAPALVARLRELAVEDRAVPACGAASTTSDASQIKRTPRPT